MSKFKALRSFAAVATIAAAAIYAAAPAETWQHIDTLETNEASILLHAKGGIRGLGSNFEPAVETQTKKLAVFIDENIDKASEIIVRTNTKQIMACEDLMNKKEKTYGTITIERPSSHSKESTLCEQFRTQTIAPLVATAVAQSNQEENNKRNASPLGKMASGVAYAFGL